MRVKQGSVMALSFEAIIFDCDGVLVDSEALGLDASTDYLRGHGFAWSPQDLVRMFTGFRDDVFAAKLTEEYRALHGCDPDAEFFSGLIETRRARRHLLQTVPGAREILETLELPKAVASSSRTEFLHGKMKRVGIFDLVAPHVYSADLVAHGKPAPDVFLYTAEQLDIDPQRCLVIEDSENGVRAGIAAGMTVWGFLGGGHIFDGHGERLLSAGAAETVDDFAALMRNLSSA
ncbi:MAG: HAD family hydrolase [Pseudomonadota bacterium]